MGTCRSDQKMTGHLLGTRCAACTGPHWLCWALIWGEVWWVPSPGCSSTTGGHSRVESPALQKSQTHLDAKQGTLLWGTCSSRGLVWVIPSVLFQPPPFHDSVQRNRIPPLSFAASAARTALCSSLPLKREKNHTGLAARFQLETPTMDTPQ